MRKMLTAFALAATLVAGGCATTGGGGTQQTPAQIVEQIRAYTQQACGFLPVANDVLTVLSAFYPGVAPGAAAVATVGGAICQAASPPAATGASTVKRVNTPQGVKSVRGTFVR